MTIKRGGQGSMAVVIPWWREAAEIHMFILQKICSCQTPRTEAPQQNKMTAEVNAELSISCRVQQLSNICDFLVSKIDFRSTCSWDASVEEFSDKQVPKGCKAI